MLRDVSCAEFQLPAIRAVSAGQVAQMGCLRSSGFIIFLECGSPFCMQGKPVEQVFALHIDPHGFRWAPTGHVKCYRSLL